MLLSFTDIFKKYKMNITGIIHVGGHYGEEIKEYINNGIQDIIVFEPLTENFDILQKNCLELDANIIGHQVALGSSCGIMNMYVSNNQKQSSSLLKPKVHLEEHPEVLFEENEIVEVDILDNYETENFNFLNMDVQGYELEVLKGAKKTLEKINYVYCEVNQKEVYEKNALIHEIDEFLLRYNMKRVETSWYTQSWGDALYIKNI